MGLLLQGPTSTSSTRCAPRVIGRHRAEHAPRIIGRCRGFHPREFIPGDDPDGIEWTQIVARIAPCSVGSGHTGAAGAPAPTPGLAAPKAVGVPLPGPAARPGPPSRRHRRPRSAGTVGTAVRLCRLLWLGPVTPAQSDSTSYGMPTGGRYQSLGRGPRPPLPFLRLPPEFGSTAYRSVGRTQHTVLLTGEKKGMRVT